MSRQEMQSKIYLVASNKPPSSPQMAVRELQKDTNVNDIISHLIELDKELIELVKENKAACCNSSCSSNCNQMFKKFFRLRADGNKVKVSTI